MPRICFLNPFGTDEYDDIISETLLPAVRGGTEVEIRHLTAGPRNIEYYVPKHLAEVEVLKAVVEAERDGFDAFVIGCCYDPALVPARELTDMPVVGALEASVSLARLFGHRFSLVTDEHKAMPCIEDLIRLYGLESNCRSVSSIDWFLSDMMADPGAVARDTYTRCVEVMDEDNSEVVVLGCTIVAACYEQAILRGATELADIAVVNPNLMALKLAEMLADMHAVGQYRVSRKAYYQQHAAHDPVEAAQVLELLTPASTASRA
ncbi:MAG: Hydantoin racemase-like protein [Conexibacter sp.]|nr:Hydantoin racemase-like protein [Conexibacter sp.]